MVEVGLVTTNKRLVKKIGELASIYDYTHQHWDTLDLFLEGEQSCKLVMFTCDIDGTSKEIAAEAAEKAQIVEHYCPEGYTIAIVPKPLAKEYVIFLKKSGVNLIIPESELFDTSKLEFFASQILRAKYVPIKEVDLEPNTRLTFDLYHLMPLKQKFLKIAKSGQLVDDERVERMKEVGEFYVLRDDLKEFNTYTKNIEDSSHRSLIRRCRAQFLNFSSVYLDLVTMLCDHSESVSFAQGKEILESCQSIVFELSQTLSQISSVEVWDVIDNSVIGEFGSVERATAVAAYASYFSEKLGIQNEITDIILAILIMDLGVIYLPDKITAALRSGSLDKLGDEDLKHYKTYPLKTIGILANRKLPLEPRVKEIILLVNENANGTGFPNKAKENQLTEASQFVRFCTDFDHKTTLKQGKQREDLKVIFEEIISKEMENFKTYTPSFCLQLRRLIAPKKKTESA